MACVRGSGESPERRLNGRKLTPTRQGLTREACPRGLVDWKPMVKYEPERTVKRLRGLEVRDSEPAVAKPNTRW